MEKQYTPLTPEQIEEMLPAFKLSYIAATMKPIEDDEAREMLRAADKELARIYESESRAAFGFNG